MILSLLPLPVRLGLAGAAAGAIFGGGWTVESWRAAGALDTEKLAHQADIAKLQHDWQTKLDAEQEVGNKARADLEAERKLNEIAQEDAQRVYEKDLAKRQADAVRLAGDAGRLRSELAAAQAAGRPASGSGAVQQADSGARCRGPDGDAACGFLARAIDLAKRCADVAGRNHAALVEVVGAWPGD